MEPHIDRLEELLVEWEERQEAGTPISAEDLCGAQTELLSELHRRIALLQRFAQIEHPSAGPATTPATIGEYVVKCMLGAGATFTYENDTTMTVRPPRLPSSKIVVVCMEQQ